MRSRGVRLTPRPAVYQPPLPSSIPDSPATPLLPLNPQSGAWKFTYGASIPLSIFMMVGVTSLPPSARWLASTGRIEEARASLNYVYSQGADDILGDIIEGVRGGPWAVLKIYVRVREGTGT